MRLKITSGTICKGKRASVGDFVEVDDNEARILIGANKAEIVNDEDRPTGPLSTTTASAIVEGEPDSDADDVAEATAEAEEEAEAEAEAEVEPADEPKPTRRRGSKKKAE